MHCRPKPRPTGRGSACLCVEALPGASRQGALSPRPYASWPDVIHPDHAAMRQILSYHEVGPNRTVRRQPRTLAFEIASLTEAGCGQAGSGKIYLVAVGIRKTHAFHPLFAAAGPGFERSLVRPALARSGKLLAMRLTLKPAGEQHRSQDAKIEKQRALDGLPAAKARQQPQSPLVLPPPLCSFPAYPVACQN